MKKQIKEYLPNQPLWFLFFISFLLVSLPFHADSEEKSDYEVRAALGKLVKRAIRSTEATVDVQQHVRHWPKPEFKNKWSKLTYEMHSVKVNIQKVQGESHAYTGTVYGVSRVKVQGPFDTRKTALSAYPMAKNPTVKRAAFQLKYVFEDGKWVLDEGLLAPFDAGTGQQGSWKKIWSPYHGGTKDRRWGVIYEYWVPK